MRLQGLLQRTIVGARLNSYRAVLRVQLNDTVHVSRKDHDDAAADSRTALVAAAASRRNGQNTVAFGQLPCEACRFTDVIFVSWIHDKRRRQLEHAFIGRKIAARIVRSDDLTLHMLLQIMSDFIHFLSVPCPYMKYVFPKHYDTILRLCLNDSRGNLCLGERGISLRSSAAACSEQARVRVLAPRTSTSTPATRALVKVQAPFKDQTKSPRQCWSFLFGARERT